jgi:hypothetical protein
MFHCRPIYGADKLISYKVALAKLGGFLNSQG